MCALPLRLENAKSATRSLFCTRAQKEIEKVRASFVEKRKINSTTTKGLILITHLQR